MSSNNHVNRRVGWCEYDHAGHSKFVAVDLEDPGSLLESFEKGEVPLDHPAREIIHRFFRMCAIRNDGKLQTPQGMAMRLCCLASLMQIYPIDGIPFREIASHCGLTRAAVSKTMLELSEMTGIRSRQQRSNHARRAYSRRAKEVHERRTRKTATPEEVTGYEFPKARPENQEGAFHSE